MPTHVDGPPSRSLHVWRRRGCPIAGRFALHQRRVCGGAGRWRRGFAHGCLLQIAALKRLVSCPCPAIQSPTRSTIPSKGPPAAGEYQDPEHHPRTPKASKPSAGRQPSQQLFKFHVASADGHLRRWLSRSSSGFSSTYRMPTGGAAQYSSHPLTFRAIFIFRSTFR